MTSTAKSHINQRNDTKKGEVGELRILLRSNDIQRDSMQYEQVVQKVIAYMTLGVDMSPLFTEMIMASATQNMVQKKMVYLYLSTYAEQNSELALLTVNTLQKDASDRNPTIRGLALRSITSLRIPNIVEYIQQPLLAGLRDKSAYVRKTAVMGVVKLFYVAPEIVTDLNLVDVLYQLLHDQDPQVICNCLSALEEILANEGGMVITKKIAHYLLNRLRDFSEWGQCQILQLLLRYKCSDEEEVFDILNVLDDRLKHVVSGVVLGTIKLFFNLTENMHDIQEDIYERIKDPLLSLIGAANHEIVYTCLQHVEIILYRSTLLFRDHYHTFFCRYNDPPYLKLKKLDLLTQVCDNHNAENIIDELGETATDVNTSVAQKAIQAIGKIAVLLSARANMCIDKLLSLLSMEIDHITSESMIVITNILRKYEITHENILPRLPGCYDIMTNHQGKAALIWIIGEYGESLPESPYLLEEIANQVSEESSSEVKLQLLSAVMKMFFRRPPECQEMLGRLLEYVIDEETDMIVRDRGLLYYRLLKSDSKAAKQIVCGTQKIVSQFTSTPKAAGLFAELNTLAVMYSQPSHEFIEQNAPYTLQTDSHIDRSSYVDEIFASTMEPSRDVVSDLVAESKRDSPVPHMLLNPKPTLSAEDFEQKWQQLSINLEEKVPIASFYSLKNFQESLADRFIITVASTPDSPVIKMFLFAQHVSTFDYFLMEVVISVADKVMKVVVKAENPKLVRDYMLHYLHALKQYL